MLLAQLQEQLTELIKKVGEVAGEVQSIKGTVDRIAPLVDNHEARNNQAKGAMHLGRGLWQIIVGSGLGAAGATIAEFFSSGHPPHHP